jgi:hypothetical protein
MSEKTDGGPAFPVNDAAMVHTVAAAAIQGVSDSAERDRIYIEASRRAASGMTLRDYFAAKALSGMLIAALDEGVRDELYAQAARRDLSPKQSVAVAAYEYADAMLRAREE